MKFKKQSDSISAEPDMTPMIDMTFQLIAFFMVLLNFGEGEQDQRIKLPSSALAKPPETASESPIVVQLTGENTVLFAGEELPISEINRPLANERRVLELHERDVKNATIFIRADASAKAGIVQEVILACQKEGFEKFGLRAKNEAEP
jgi:biopolymer transport protein ExbD